MTVSLNTMKFQVKVDSLPVPLTQFVLCRSLNAHIILKHMNVKISPLQAIMETENPMTCTGMVFPCL